MMNEFFIAGMIGGWELVLILAVVLVLFGAKKLPELARGLGTGIKEFKKATRDVSEELNSAMDLDSPPPPPRRITPPVEASVEPSAETTSDPSSASRKA